MLATLHAVAAQASRAPDFIRGDDGGTPPDVEVTLTPGVVDDVNDLRVDAVFVGPGDIPTEQDVASAFLVGATIDQLSPANIEAVLTSEADFEDPESTLTAVKTALSTA